MRAHAEASETRERLRVERERIEPDRAQPLARRLVAQIGEADAVRARVGKRRIGRARARELGIQLDHVTDIDHHQERWAAFARRQRASVLLGLPASPEHRVVEALAFGFPDLLCLQDQRRAPIAVDKSARLSAVAVPEGDAALEDVRVVARILARRVGRGQVEQRTQLVHEKLIVGAFRPAGGLPAFDEPLYRVIRVAHHDLYQPSHPRIARRRRSFTPLCRIFRRDYESLDSGVRYGVYTARMNGLSLWAT